MNEQSLCANRPALAMNRTGGFSLNELLVSVAIIGILATIALPRYADIKTRASLTAAKSTLSSLANAAQHFYLDQGRFPSSVTFDSMIDLRPLAHRHPTYIQHVKIPDPFQRPLAEDRLETMPFAFWLFNSPQSEYLHGFVYINYRDFISADIPTIRGIGIYSIGPDRIDSMLSLYPLPDVSKLMVRQRLLRDYGESAYQPTIVYSPTNGLYSAGDFGVFRGEFSGFVPQDL